MSDSVEVTMLTFQMAKDRNEDRIAMEVSWGDYQQRLGNLTEREESMIHRAFWAGWVRRGNQH